MKKKRDSRTVTTTTTNRTSKRIITAQTVKGNYVQYMRPIPIYSDLFNRRHNNDKYKKRIPNYMFKKKKKEESN